MILYYFPIAQNTVSKTFSENIYRGSVCLHVNVHIFYNCSINWSDSSLIVGLETHSYISTLTLLPSG